MKSIKAPTTSELGRNLDIDPKGKPHQSTVLGLVMAVGVALFSSVAISDESKALEETTLRMTPGISGEYRVLAVREGDRVEKGMVLAELDNAHLEAAVVAAQSREAYALATMEEASREHERNMVLYDEGSLSRVELDLGQIALLKAKADHDAAVYEHLHHRYRLGQSRLISPGTGEVVDVEIRVGQRVNVLAEHQPGIVLELE